MRGGALSIEAAAQASAQPRAASAETDARDLPAEVLAELAGGRRRHTTYCRFSAFEQLRQLLAASLPDGGAGLPPLPRKTLSFHAGVGDADFVANRRAELDRFLQGMLAPPPSGVAAGAPKDRTMWGGRTKGRGAPPLGTHHGLTFLGLLPGASHRQPIAPPPFSSGEAAAVVVDSVEVLRGLQEDGYVDYEVCALYTDASASDGSAAASRFFTYCRFSKFLRLQSLLEKDVASGGGGASDPLAGVGEGGVTTVLLPELPKKTLSMHGGVDDAVFVEQRCVVAFAVAILVLCCCAMC